MRLHDLAIEEYDEAIRRNPQDASLFYNRGIIWRSRNEHDKAILDFTEAIRLDPNDANPFFDRGGCWWARKEYDKALQDSNEAIRLDPRYTAVFAQRGGIWKCKKEYHKAIQDYDEAIRLGPPVGQFFYYRGCVWLAKNEYDRAILDFDEAVRRSPDYSYSFIVRGNAWLAKKEYDRAILDYNEFLRLVPQYMSALYNLSLALSAKLGHNEALAGGSDLDLGDPQVTLADIALSPEIDHCSYIFFHDHKQPLVRALFRATKRPYDHAVKTLERTLRHNPLGWLHRDFASFRATYPEERYRDGKKAVALARRALALAGQDADWSYAAALAAAHAEVGEFDKAVAEQTRALADEALSGIDRVDMDERLKLYQENQPYRDRRFMLPPG